MSGQQQRHVTERLPDTLAGRDRAAVLLTQGRLVAFPTETVYGLGADATNTDAVRAIYAAKNRPSFNPLIVHVADMKMAKRFGKFDEMAEYLAARFWPGGLTLVVPLQDDAGLPREVTAGLSSVALRMPANESARALIRAVGLPLAAPSANPSGRVSATTADHVLSGLDGRIAAVLDGGPTTLGLESTIVAVTPDGPRLLRAGSVTSEALGFGATPASVIENKAPTSPGQLASHYAPKGTVRLNATDALPGEVMIGFGDTPGDVTLSATGDLDEAAASLFAVLHDMDARGADRIAVAPIPETGIGRAINDRLRRAAAPRN